MGKHSLQRPYVQDIPTTYEEPPTDVFEPVARQNQYFDEMPDSDERWEELDEDLNAKFKLNWRPFIVVTLHLLVFVPALLYAGFLMGSCK